MTEMEGLVAALIPELEPLLSERPFAFFGHSMGALLAYETLRGLQRRGLPEPAHLLVAGSRAPQAELPVPTLHDMPEPQLMDHLRRFNGTPERILADRDLMGMFLPLVRADLSVSERYSCSETGVVRCPVSAFAGTRDDHASPARVREWKAQALGEFSFTEIDGDHFFLQSSRTAFLTALRGELERYAVFGDGS